MLGIIKCDLNNWKFKERNKPREIFTEVKRVTTSPGVLRTHTHSLFERLIHIVSETALRGTPAPLNIWTDRIKEMKTLV